jgi:hypothetical protein
MMNNVVEEHLAVSQKPRPFKNGLALESRSPARIPGFVRCVDEGLTDLGCAFVKYSIP